MIRPSPSDQVAVHSYGRRDELTYDDGKFYKVNFTRKTIKKLTSGLFIVDPTYTIVSVDDRIEELFDIQKEHIIGDSILKLVDSSYIEMVKEYNKRRLLGDTSIPEFYKLRTVTKHGKKQNMMVRARSFVKRSGDRYTLVQIVQ